MLVVVIGGGIRIKTASTAAMISFLVYSVMWYGGSVKCDGFVMWYGMQYGGALLDQLIDSVV